jgi:outer membrane protein assembly factor BamB
LAIRNDSLKISEKPPLSRRCRWGMILPGPKEKAMLQTLVIVLASFAPAAAPDSNWLDFRGPTGQGHVGPGHPGEGDLPVEWSATRNVAWKQPVPGLGWSSPVVVNGQVIVTSAVPVEADATNGSAANGNAANGNAGQALSLRVLAYDVATGKPRWDTEVFQQPKDAPRIHGKNSHASPTAVVRGDSVFVHFGHQGTACLGLDGQVKWRNRELAYAPVHGNGGTPALVQDMLVYSADGASDPFLAALDQKSGQLRWKASRDSDAPKKFSFSTPLVIQVDGQTQIISPGSNSVGAFDPANGKEIWRVRYQGYSVIPRPIFANGLVYISTGYDSPSVMAIRPDGAGDVTDSHVAWVVKKGAPHTPSLLAVGDWVFMVSDRGVATCLDAKTGAEVWQERLGGNYSASPLHADGKIYFQSEEGDTTVVRAAAQYEMLAKNSLGERTLASYAVTGRALLIRGAANLYRVEMAP